MSIQYACIGLTSESPNWYTLIASITFFGNLQNKVLAILIHRTSNIVRDELAFRWRCLSKTFSQRDMVRWVLRNQTGPVFNFF